MRNRENLKISDKKSSTKEAASVKTMTTSDGLKIGIDLRSDTTVIIAVIIIVMAVSE